MHAEMVLILIVTLVIAQIALVEWKKRYYKSYSVSIIGMFVFWTFAHWFFIWFLVGYAAWYVGDTISFQY